MLAGESRDQTIILKDKALAKNHHGRSDIKNHTIICKIEENDNSSPYKRKAHNARTKQQRLVCHHRAKGHDTEKCFRLRDLIKELIRSGHLRKFIDDAAQGRVVVPKV
ncbi:hypothetical protein L195_g054828 [Trifolium pratense]|uniref:Uncharacterized protein n=1 Tax=Trifolium pratense TaxID=57577 RepID=A0A2K3KIA3_TRIPR|nr:hypothetical protein L195_g054828 [Trifolium pratense]